MTETDPQRRLLIVIGLAMVTTIAAMIVFAARSQNLYGRVAEIEALDAVTGETVWELERDVTGFIESREAAPLLLLRGRDSVVAVDKTGSVVWEASHGGAERIALRGNHVWLSDGPDGTTQLSAEDGKVGWNRTGRFMQASTGLAALELYNPRRLVVVAVESGERLHKFRYRHKDDFALDHQEAVRLRKGVLWLLSEDGTSRKVLEDLPERSWLAGFRDGVVVVSHRNEEGSGVILRGHAVATGEELWRHTEPQQFTRYAGGDAIHIVRVEGGELALDIRTGNEVPDRRFWRQSSAGATGTLLAPARELVTFDASTRYVNYLRTTYAVDVASGSVLWTRPGDLPVAATAGLAAFNGDEEVQVVAAASGEVVATVNRKGRTRIRAAGGRVLVGTGQKVQVIDDRGTTTTIFDKKARVDALSADYAVFSKDVDPDTRPKQIFIYDLDTGSQIVTEPISFTFQAWFDGDDLMIGNGSAQLIVDPETGQIEARGTRRSEYAEPEEFADVMVAFDGDLSTMRWSRDMGRAHDIAVVDDVVVLISTRTKHIPQEGI